MANDNATSNYFTVVTYPLEFTRDDALWEVGTVFESPIHNANIPQVPSTINSTVFRNYKGETYVYTDGKLKKPHVHVLIKTPNKMTEKAFIEKLCKALDKDLTGLALHQGDALVKQPQTMIRYFYHLDSPMKESFDVLQAFQFVPNNFTKEVVKALDVEIRAIITGAIQRGEIENINNILFYNNCSLVFTEWLYQGRNMYVINSMFNEIRKNERIKTDAYNKKSYC